ncbi:carbonate dehydratase [Simkania negevensis]|uniref:Carbonic anhydrase n=1 Tax=Simkania negevensis TaxID=83561 RepID=A0ABS3ATQ9_9BACT|nr:carbonate dehydratase [Simkania negevensis]
MKELPRLFKNNDLWVEQSLAKDPNFFNSLAKEQSPRYLWIGCSDSRVPANEIVGLEAGELFVHRNIANLCIHTDFSFLSVLEFAVVKLKVEHVIVCGHYGCGGILAALENEELGLVDNWLRNIRDIITTYAQELKALPLLKERFRRLVEISVFEQVKNVCHTSIVQKAWKSSKHLCVHAWVYDLSTGRLKDLNASFSSLDQIEDHYRTA